MRALLVLYYFPPSGGPGVQRGVKLCRYLPEHGVEPAVVTVRAGTYAAPGEYAADPSLGREVSDGLPVVRTPGGERTGLKRSLAALRLTRLAQVAIPRLFFERQAGWFDPGVAGCLKEIDRFRPDVLLTSSQPYIAHRIGREVKRRTGIPWVADFRDPWTLAWRRPWPSRGAFRWEQRRETEVLVEADRVVVNTPGSRRQMLERRPWLSPGKMDVVPNGYDEEDFLDGPSQRPDTDCLVVHAGSFRAVPPGSARTGARGVVDRLEYSPVPYDLSTHSPEPLFRALAILRDTPGAPVVTARHVGPLPDGWRRFAAELGVLDRVELLGYRPHREATAHLLAADALFLPTLTRRDGMPVSNVPAKAYEYLGSGRPIAALCDAGDVRDLVGGRDRVRVLPVRDAAALAGMLTAAAGAGLPSEAPDPPDARPWRRREVARRMAASLRAACGRFGLDSVSDPTDKTRGRAGASP